MTVHSLCRRHFDDTMERDGCVFFFFFFSYHNFPCSDRYGSPDSGSVSMCISSMPSSHHHVDDHHRGVGTMTAGSSHQAYSLSTSPLSTTSPSHHVSSSLHSASSAHHYPTPLGMSAMSSSIHQPSYHHPNSYSPAPTPSRYAASAFPSTETHTPNVAGQEGDGRKEGGDRRFGSKRDIFVCYFTNS